MNFVVDEIRTGIYRELFHPDQLISGKEDAASNYARGYYSIGPTMMEKVNEAIRHVVEDCDAIQGFLMFRAFGGGTGSGFTALLLDQLLQDYTRTQKVEFSVYPAPRISPLIVEPYNAMLTTHGTIESEDLCFIVDNEACYDICANLLDVPYPTYTNINRLIAQV